MITWEVTIHSKRDNELLYFEQGQNMSGNDAFTKILGNGNAQVGLDLSLTTPIGDEWVKLNAVVRLTCNQDERTIDEAANLCLKKVNEYAMVGLKIVAEARTKAMKR